MRLIQLFPDSACVLFYRLACVFDLLFYFIGDGVDTLFLELTNDAPNREENDTQDEEKEEIKPRY